MLLLRDKRCRLETKIGDSLVAWKNSSVCYRMLIEMSNENKPSDVAYWLKSCIFVDDDDMCSTGRSDWWVHLLTNGIKSGKVYRLPIKTHGSLSPEFYRLNLISGAEFPSVHGFHNFNPLSMNWHFLHFHIRLVCRKHHRIQRREKFNESLHPSRR